MDFALFKKKALTSFHLDLNAYKENQLKRRLESLMVKQKLNQGDYASFYKLLTAGGKAYVDFLDTLTINVSEFFRDKSMFLFLEEQVLPALLAKKRNLKIWSAACSSGAEPYSLALILDEITPQRRHQIEASDIDRNILKMAAAACYNQEQVRNVSAGRKKKYFRPVGRQFILNENIKKRVTFRKHDLLLDPFGEDYDLITCRNVTIYFTRQAQEKLYPKFFKALSTGGVLFVGASEMIFNYREQGFEKIASCFYRKK
jgi:chemotaxis protein methyltransferase CheR